MQADIVRIQAFVFNEQSGRTVSVIPSIISDNTINKLSALETFNRLATHNWIPGICWSIIRREHLLKHQLFFKEGSSTEDQLFYIQRLTLNKQAYIILL